MRQIEEMLDKALTYDVFDLDEIREELLPSRLILTLEEARIIVAKSRIFGDNLIVWDWAIDALIRSNVPCEIWRQFLCGLFASPRDFPLQWRILHIAASGNLPSDPYLCDEVKNQIRRSHNFWIWLGGPIAYTKGVRAIRRACE
ncbi:MAG: hypothetical protein JNM34_06180 [Chthonomonadaceae bacterium]|nr:hypothetical protein [Chthonomonadaceae bacterium]